MADTTLSYVNAPDITIDEAFVGLSGAITTTSANTAATFGTVSLAGTRA